MPKAPPTDHHLDPAGAPVLDPGPRRVRANPYVVAVLATAAVAAVRLLLEPWLRGQAPMILFTVAVVIAAQSGGLKPGLLATGLSVLSGGYLFVGRQYVWWPAAGPEFARMFLFVLAGVLISTFTERLRRAMRRRNEAEEMLRRYELLASNSQDIMLFVDADSGRILEANAAATAAYGYTRDELLALTIYDLRSEAARGLTARQMAAADRGGVEFETEHRRKDGSCFPVEVRSHGASLNGARTLLSVVRDITRRRKDEEALIESEERFAKAFATNPAGIVLTTVLEGRIIDVNETWQTMFGYSRDEALGRTLADLAIWPSPDNRERAGSAVLERGTFVNEELSLRRRSGEILVCLGSAATLYVAGEQVVLSAWLDITERKRAEVALRKSEAQMRAVFRSLAEGIVFLNKDGEVEEANEAAFRLHGHALEELTDPASDPRGCIVRPDGTPFPVEEQPAIVALRTGEAVRDVEMGVPTADGRFVWRLVNAQPVYDDGGKLLGAVASFFDITDRRRAEDALRESDRRKDEFIAVLSHELRNPLAPIRYALPLVQREALSPTGARAAEVIDRQVEHLTRLVDDLLDVSRISRDKIELRPEMVTLADVVAAGADASSPAIHAARHTLRLDIPAETIWLRADPARLSQVVTNLLNNSARYTPRGGEIILVARMEREQAVIRVRDNGIGIPSSALPTIFDMFQQVNRPDSSQGGLGIGLALVKRLVEMHGGTVAANSPGVGEGAEFVVRLPVVDAAAVGGSAHAAARGPAGRRLKVLVVDDNADLVEMLALLVEAAGHDVRKALDGRSAVSAALAYRPDVVLLDLGLPVMSGLEVARELRGRQETAHVRLVALTGWGQAEDRRQTEEAGFDRHLTKPADPETLNRLLQEFGRAAQRA